MYLRKLTFRENEGKTIEWLIDNVHLGKINLIVGENSSGKTRTLNALSELVNLLTGSSNESNTRNTNDTSLYGI